MSARAPKPPPVSRPGSPRPVPPPTDRANWKKLMNFLYVHEEDALFRWLRGVRRAAEDAAQRERAA